MRHCVQTKVQQRDHQIQRNSFIPFFVNVNFSSKYALSSKLAVIECESRLHCSIIGLRMLAEEEM